MALWSRCSMLRVQLIVLTLIGPIPTAECLVSVVHTPLGALIVRWTTGGREVNVPQLSLTIISPPVVQHTC